MKVSHKAAIKVLVKTGVSSEGIPGKTPLSRSLTNYWQGLIPCGLLH